MYKRIFGVLIKRQSEPYVLLSFHQCHTKKIWVLDSLNVDYGIDSMHLLLQNHKVQHIEELEFKKLDSRQFIHWKVYRGNYIYLLDKYYGLNEWFIDKPDAEEAKSKYDQEQNEERPYPQHYPDFGTIFAIPFTDDWHKNVWEKNLPSVSVVRSKIPVLELVMLVLEYTDSNPYKSFYSDYH
jgi:hypothetical protein